MKVKSALCALLVSSAQVAMSTPIGLSIEGRVGHRHSRSSGAESQKETNGLDVRHANSWTLGTQYQFSQEVPVSAGLDLTLVQGYKSDLTDSTKTDSIKSHYGFEVTPMVKAWLPESVHGVSYLKPFAKVGYVAYSNYVLEKQAKGTREITSNPGFVTGLGTDVAVNEMLVINAGYTYFNTKSSTKAIAKKGATTHTHEFAFGVQVSI
jgi:opacity protein-like surface antigen